MSRLSDLLREVARGDDQLARDLAAEIRHLGDRRAFGLNFERHTPETVELPGRQIRKGDKVRFLPTRGAERGSVDRRLWRVSAISRTDVGKIATLVRQESNATTLVTVQRALEDLVVRLIID